MISSTLSHPAEVFRKIVRYRNVSLHLRIFTAIISVSQLRSRGFLAAVPSSVRERSGTPPTDINLVRRYCGLWLTLRKRVGYHDTCYFRSTVICRVLRRSGIDARLNFGTMKKETRELCNDDWHLTGHCWVSLGDETTETVYPFVIQYPSEGTA